MPDMSTSSASSVASVPAGADMATAPDGSAMLGAADPGGAATSVAHNAASGWLPDPIAHLQVIDLIDRAGAVGWVLAALAVIGLFLFFYKLVGFIRRGLFADGFVKPLEAALTAGDEGAATQTLSRRRHPAAEIGRFCLGLPVGSAESREAVSDLVATRARKEIDDLNGGLRLISAIAVLSPLLGLLGTVMGMINAFQQMEGAGSRIDPSVLSGGIWLALLTTAIGLVVAIPATAMHMWMQSVIARAAGVTEEVCTMLVNRDELAATGSSASANVTRFRHAAE